MCSDYGRAAENRRMVRLKQNVDGYIYIETLVKNWPYKMPLPAWLYHELPRAGKGERLYGFHKVRINEEN